MKKIYPASALLFLFTFFFLPAKAQKNYTKGYVVTTQNDTIRGFIDDKDWSKNPDVIRFKKDIADSQFTKYSPAQLRSFYIEPTNDYYISYLGKIDYSPFKIQQLVEVTDDSDFLQKDHTITDTAFLNVLSEGTISLYFYKDREQKEHFFFQKGKGLPQELVFQKYIKEMENGQKFIREVRTYRGQLREAMTDCEKVQKVIPKATYTKQSLTQLVNLYNTCSSQHATYQKTPEKTKFAIGAVVGISKTSFLHSTTSTSFEYTDSYNPVLGVSFNFILPRNHNSWSVYTDIFWKAFQTKAAKTPQNTFERNLKVNATKANVMVRYSLPKEGLQPFINAGASASFLINAQGNILTNSDQDYKEFDKMMFGLQGGAGATLKKHTLELRYERTRSVFNGPLTGTFEHNLYVLFSYRLK